MGLAPRLRSLAGALADDVYVAPSATCCGFAGDRGISHPELTAAATRPQAAERRGRHFDAHLSSNRTCEIGLSRATGAATSRSILLLERLTAKLAAGSRRPAPCSSASASTSRIVAADPRRRCSMRRSSSGLMMPRRAET